MKIYFLIKKNTHLIFIFKDKWKKIFKELRIFNGLWLNSNIKFQIDSYCKNQNEQEEFSEKNNFYINKVSKYETRSRMRPFLKIILNEPRIAIDYNEKLRSKQEEQQKKKISYFSSDLNQKNRSHKSSSNDIKVPQKFVKNKFFDLTKGFSNFGKNLTNSIKVL